MELRLPLEMSPGREAACRAVFGTWGFFRTMHGKTAPSCGLHSQGGVQRGVRASGSYQEGTGKSGSYGMWNPPRGHVWKDRKSTRLNSSHHSISYAVFCLKKKKKKKLKKQMKKENQRGKRNRLRIRGN